MTSHSQHSNGNDLLASVSSIYYATSVVDQSDRNEVTSEKLQGMFNLLSAMWLSLDEDCVVVDKEQMTIRKECKNQCILSEVRSRIATNKDKTKLNMKEPNRGDMKLDGVLETEKSLADHTRQGYVNTIANTSQHKSIKRSETGTMSLGSQMLRRNIST